MVEELPLSEDEGRRWAMGQALLSDCYVFYGGLKLAGFEQGMRE